MGVRFAVITACLAGCATLSGLDDKSADLEDGVAAPNRPSSDDASPSSSGGPTPTADGSPLVDGRTPDKDGSLPPNDAPASGTRIRDITFENGALVHPTSGFDSTLGGAELLTASPLAGSYSMRATGTAKYGTIAFAAIPDLYLTMKLRVAPADPNTAGDARFLKITPSNGLVIEAYVRSGPRDLVITQGAKDLAKFPNLLTDGTSYRLELRILGTGSFQARLVSGGSNGLVGSSTNGTSFTKVEVGAVSGGTFDATFDDISIDSAVQP